MMPIGGVYGFNARNVANQFQRGNRSADFAIVFNTEQKNQYREIEEQITKEEDEILADQLRKAGVNLDEHPLEWQKRHLVAFPPLTAPGSVRRAWRQALEKMSPNERSEAAQTALFAYLNYKEENAKSGGLQDNFTIGYFQNIIQWMKDYNDFTKGHRSQQDYNNFGLLLDSFKENLASISQ